MRRLAVYWPLNEGAQRAIFRQLVLALAHENGGQIGSCMAVQELFRTHWGLDVERHEISTAIRQLVEAGKLIREEVSIKLAPATARELASRVRTSKQVEAEAFRDWDHRIRREIAPSLGDSQRNELQQDLITWIHAIVIDQGIAAAAVLHPAQKLFAQRVEEIRAYGFDQLPERDPSITMVRASALQAFFTRMTEAQRSYINHMAATAYLMSALTLDSAALPKVRRIATGQRLYLDTNIIYSLLGLHGKDHEAAVQRVVSQSRELGYLLCATLWTVRELRESVRSARHAYGRHQISRQGEPLSTPGSDGHEVLMRQLRKLERDRGFSPEQFLAYQEQVDSLLEDLGIKVVSDGCDAIDADPSRVEAEIARLEEVSREPKLRPLQEHDVKHRLLIEDLRGPQKRNLSDADYVMLTHDRDLLLYAGVDKEDDEPAFAVGVRLWRQTVRTIKPRTASYEESFEKVIGTRSVGASEVIDTAETIEAILRITDYEDLSPTATTRAMYDGALGAAASEINADLEAAAEVVVGPHEAAVLRAENLALRQRLIAEERAHAETKVAATAELEGERRERSEAEAFSEEASELGTLMVSLQEQKAELKTLRWIVALLIALAGAASIAIPAGAGWITRGWSLVANICASGTIEMGAFAWLYGPARAWKLVATLGVLVTIVAAVQSFVGA